MHTFTILLSPESAANPAVFSTLTDIASGKLTVDETAARFTGAMDRATANGAVEALAAIGVSAAVEQSTSVLDEAVAAAQLALAVSDGDVPDVAPSTDIVITAQAAVGDVLTPITHAVQGLVIYREPPTAMVGDDFEVYASTTKIADVKAAVRALPFKVTVRKA